MATGSDSESLAAGMSLDEALAADIDVETQPGLQIVIEAVADAASEIATDVRRAALAGVLGKTGEINIQGEQVEKLDEIGLRRFVEHLTACGRVVALASEELEETKILGGSEAEGYITVFDPIDGSSNIDVAISIGSIFGIYLKPLGEPITNATILRPGREQVAATYVVYGSSTVMVVATAASVRGFTLDPESGRFFLSHPVIRIPDGMPYYSVNEGNYPKWDSLMQKAVVELRNAHSLRYVGSLVADFHRNLLKGGVFLYPGDRRSPEGKLRLLYEAIPLGYVAEQAGGKASNGHARILDLQPKAVHERSPLIVGNTKVVERIEAILDGS